MTMGEFVAQEIERQQSMVSKAGETAVVATAYAFKKTLSLPQEDVVKALDFCVTVVNDLNDGKLTMEYIKGYIGVEE